MTAHIIIRGQIKFATRLPVRGSVLDDIIDELNYMKENIMKLEKNYIVIQGGIFYEKNIYSC